MVKELWKTKKTRGFFGFWMFVVLDFFWVAHWKTKNLEFFLVFHNFLTIILSKKQKNLEFFWLFQGQNQKKQRKLGKTKKNQTWTSDQTFSEKFWFFVVVGFLEFFLILSIEFSQRVSKYCFLLVFSRCFDFLGFPFGFSPKELLNIFFVSNLFW